MVSKQKIRFIFGLMAILFLFFIRDEKLARGFDNATAGNPYLVKDVYPGNDRILNFTAVKDQLFINIRNPEGIPELWYSDCTAEGTLQIKNFQPAPVDNLFNFKDSLFFVVNNNELWRRMDGNMELVKKVTVPAPYTSAKIHVIEHANGYLFFFVDEILNESIARNTIWRSDGTPAGTIALKSFKAFNTMFGTDNPFFQFLVANSSLFFKVAVPPGIIEIWRTDGTPSGTVLWREDPPDPGITLLADFENSLYYKMPGTGGSPTIWRYDGTVDGSTPVYHFAGLNYYSIENFTSVNGLLFFRLWEHLWASDGTTENTFWVKSFKDGLWDLVNSSGTLFFIANGNQLWLSDGTAAGTRMVRDFVNISIPLTSAYNRVYFSADDGVHGYELWQSDGSQAGTYRIKDINPGTASSHPGAFTAVRAQNVDLLYFIADDGNADFATWCLPVTVYTHFENIPVLMH